MIEYKEREICEIEMLIKFCGKAGSSGKRKDLNKPTHPLPDYFHPLPDYFIITRLLPSISLLFNINLNLVLINKGLFSGIRLDHGQFCCVL